jgi:hypothetical protein
MLRITPHSVERPADITTSGPKPRLIAAARAAILTKRMSEVLMRGRHFQSFATIVAVMPAKAGIQYAVKVRRVRGVSEYWVTRLRG